MKKKLIAIAFTLLLVAGITGTFWGPSLAQAASSVWNTCPLGRVNCAYPGDCHSYIDTNRDYICDRSQSSPITSTAVVSPATTTTTISPVTTSITSTVTSQNTITSSVTAENSGTAKTSSSYSYWFLPILVLVGTLYTTTWILSSVKKITTAVHRKIWNLVLLISTILSAVLGLFLILNIEFGINITLPVDMLFWHVEAGIVLGIVAIFHIFWHRRYFARILKLARQE
jgi:hypothetical protein